MGFLTGYARKIGVLEYLGTWNAATNNPHLQSGEGQKNGYYIVSDAGNTNLDGVTGWETGDWVLFNGQTWEQIDNQSPSSSFMLIDGGTALETEFDSNIILDGGSA